MSDPRPFLSVSVEDYLKAIYALATSGEGTESVTTSALAESLAVQPASVSGMVKRLAESGYVEHTPYYGVKLTDAGAREALRIIRRHRVIETYLCTRLGYNWDDVHEEAERLEHAASDELIERMAASLEDPTHDPHGSPIPTADGQIAPEQYPSLAVATADELIVRSVEDEDPARLRYLEENHLVPGARIRVVDRAPFSGPVTVRREGSLGQSLGKPLVLGNDLASRIFVSPVSDGG